MEAKQRVKHALLVVKRLGSPVSQLGILLCGKDLAT